MFTVLILVLGAFCAGFVNGVAGFGTGLVAIGIWLFVVEPVTAAVLVVICALVAQLQSLYAVRRSFSLQRSWPFIIGGLVGVPIGVAFLKVIDPNILKGVLGLALVGYAIAMFSIRRQMIIAHKSRSADGIVGLGAGVLGGVAGLSGPLVVIWCGLKGWSADTQRSVYQPFNLVILTVAFLAYASQGILTKQNLGFALICLPATILGVYLGTRAYKRVNEQQFRSLIYGLLLLSGFILVWSNIFSTA